jgi:hypothetical protein
MNARQVLCQVKDTKISVPSVGFTALLYEQMYEMPGRKRLTSLPTFCDTFTPLFPSQLPELKE